MVHIYTFCSKTLVGKKVNLSANLLCENLFKLNFIIDEVCIFGNDYNFDEIHFKNKDIYFLLMQKSSAKLNSYLASLSQSDVTTNETLKNVVSDYFTRKNIPMEKNTENEWSIPSIATPITNPNGITQGYLLKLKETTIFVLPNNFNEFFAIYNDCLLNYLEENFAIEYKSETYKTFGLSEELLINAIKDQIKNRDKVHISVFSKGLENDIVIKAKNDNEKFDSYRQSIFNKLGNYIYAVQPISMDDYLDNLIKTNNPKISLIGDLSVNKIVDNLKMTTVSTNISSLTIIPNKNISIKLGEQEVNLKGEITAELAYDLAVKVLNGYPSDIVLSCLTNFEKSNKGTSFVAIGNKLKIDVYVNQFFGTQEEILNNVSQLAKFYLIKKLKSRDYKTI